MASKIDNEDVLYRLACECEDVFNQLHKSISKAKPKAMNSELCAEFQQRFSIWAAYLGVFAQESQCLDTRLRDFPDLQDLVARLLDILRCSLLQYKDELNSQGEGDPALLGFDEPLSKASPTPSAALTAIDNTLDRLNRLGVTIRQTSHDKIDIRAEKSTAGLNLTSFAYLCIHAVQTLYPGANQFLKDYLKESMMNRYKRMLHHNSRYTQLKAPREPHIRLPTITEVSDNELQTNVSDIPPAKAIPIAESLQKVVAAPSQAGLSSVNTQHIRSRHKPPDEASTRFHKTSSVQVNEGNYPRLPITNGNSNIFTCEWCSEPLNKKILSESESEWRRHIDRDLKPYVCISEACSEAHPTYPTFDEWCRHMGYHNRQWYQQVYLSTWVHACTLCESNHDFYDSQQDLYLHLINSHNNDFTNEQLQVISRQSKIRIKQPRTWNECCLCYFKVEEQGDQGKVVLPKRRKGLSKQEASKSAKKNYAMMHPSHYNSDPDFSDTSSNPDIDSHQDRSQQTEDRSKTMARHIAGHLQVLMLLTLRFAALQKDDGTLNDDGAKSDYVDIDDASNASKCNDLKNPPGIDSRADITIKDTEDKDDEEDATDMDDDAGKDDILIPDTDLDLVYIPRHYDDLAIEDDNFLKKVIESGAYQSWQHEHENPTHQYNMDYTVGWICAIPIEYVAAQAFLDEKHERPEYVSPNDNNDYTLGKIGRHNVVIAVHPSGEYGISSTASVARDMLHSFSNVRIGLLVGIGGGAPSPRHDIRLGDVVVGVPNHGQSEHGVIQYEFGEAMQGQKFQETGFLNQPPRSLRAAVTGLRTDHLMYMHRIRETINDTLDKHPRLRKKFARPELTTDRLYRSQVVHPLNSETDCAIVCGDDPTDLIERPERDKDKDDDPAIHYGLIASANRLMRDASVRDEITANKPVFCFETDAAGLMNNFPCVVIRGICDYSDSHANTKWQGYAAMTAAAYAKDLLYRIPPNRVEAEKKISDILSGNHEIIQQNWGIAEEHRNIMKKQLRTQEDLANERLSERERECHKLFRLTSSNEDATYEWYKNRIEQRVEGTCSWFLSNEHYQAWLQQDSGPLLVTADPGCGKSVLAKHLIDHGLPRFATICYFFFKDQDQNTSRQALCALLHQLFSQKPHLIKHAMPHFDQDEEKIINSTKSLWHILQNATKDPEAGSIIIVFDALDECAEPEFADLVRNVESQFDNSYSSGSEGKQGRLKYLLTCRPYEQITSQFHGLLQKFPNIRIPGEEESESISEEINRVITHRITQLLDKRNISAEISSYLEKRLQETAQRTYLWVSIILNCLEENVLVGKSQEEIELIITTNTKKINAAYEKILDKCKDIYMARRAFSITLAASRPLTLSEMNIAMSIYDTTQDDTTITFKGLHLKKETYFKARLRSLCGLFISIYHDKVYFLHQTAREFLLADSASPTTIPSKQYWHHSFTIRKAHNTLAELCVLYLNLFKSRVTFHRETYGATSNLTHPNAFLDYSAKNWGAHFREACVADDAAIVPFAGDLCDPNSQSYFTWFEIHGESEQQCPTGNLTSLIIASYYGYRAVVKLLIEKGADIEAKDDRGRTPLLWATNRGHEDIVKLLVERGADIEARDVSNHTPLLWAAERGYEAIVKLLVKKGADIKAKVKYSQTPLSYAAEKGYEATIELLTKQGAEKGYEATIGLLIKQGADIEAKNEYGQTPLSWAAEGGYEAIVKLLIEMGANIEAKDEYDQTPLSWAAEEGHEAIVKLLIEMGADIEAKDEYSQTPLSYAAEEGHEAIVKLLIKQGADIETKDDLGRTPLLHAAEKGHRAVVKLLLKEGADIEAKDKYGRTPLLNAIEERPLN